MKIGLVYPRSLPSHGGAEVYEHRVANALEKLGNDVYVFSGTPTHKSKFNGNFSKITRSPDRFKYKPISWDKPKPRKFEKYLEHVDQLFQQHALIESAIEWTREHKFDVVIVGIGWSAPWWLHAREYFLAVKALGIPIGLFHYDNALSVERMLVKTYLKTRDWEHASELVTSAMRESCADNNEKGGFFDLAFFAGISSPLLFRPDFIITCSEWVSRFIDPFETVEKFVFHPILELDQERGQNLKSKYHTCDVLMVNPQHRKNPELMLRLIDSNPGLSFRFLRGGWDKDPVRALRPKLKKMEAFKNGQVDIVKYAPNIEEVYTASRLLFFPSYTEGYGQAAVEPMAFNIPVVASSYPAVAEAVGQLQPSLCPYINSPDEWSELVNQALRCETEWKQLAADRCAELKVRETVELVELQSFLETQTDVR